MEKLDIAVASADDLLMLSDWAADEGWNPGRNDGIAFACADPHGFLIGRVAGVPAVSISVVQYGKNFGFLGFYIARPPFRGKGYAIQIWRAGLARLAGRNVGLDGVIEQQENYRKSGFTKTWNNIRFMGTQEAADLPANVKLIDVRRLPFDLIAAYDSQFFPAARDAFLACWVALPGRKALAAMHDGEIAGLGVIRPSRDGSRIGPLYATSPEVAASLVSNLASSFPGPVAIDVPDINPRAIALMAQLGFAPQFEAARMYTGPAPEIDAAGLYGVTSLELG